VLESSPFSSFNPAATGNGSETNNRIDFATHSGFNSVDDKLKLVKNESFGKYQKVSDNPLTIKYTINAGVQWSDGEPVSAADLMLQWAAESGYFDSATLKDGKVTKGTRYFDPAGGTTSLAQAGLPVVGDDGTSLTLSYATPPADWETALGSPVSIPAHIVAVRAGLKDASALSDLFKAVPKGDVGKPLPADPTLAKVAGFWNTGFNTTTMPDPTLALSNGPYLVQGIDPGRELVLTRNVDFAWGAKPVLDTITVNYAATTDAKVTALLDGTADIISPVNSLELYAQLKDSTKAKVNIDQGQSLDFDQAILNFKGVFASPDLRKAFLKTIPRKDLVDTLIKPMDANAVPFNSFLFAAVQTPYKEAVGSNGSPGFGAVDIPGAKGLLGTATPKVRILYNKADSASTEEFNQIAASAALAGFKVADAGTAPKNLGQAIKSGAFDVLLSTAAINPLGAGGVKERFGTGQPGNVNGYSNPVVDQLVAQLVTEPDTAKQNALKVQIERLVWEDAYGLPLFLHIGINASSTHADGVAYSPVPVGVWWNAWNWKYTK